MKGKFTLFLLIASVVAFAQNLHQYINPMIGTGGTGHTFPGATVPHGMVQLSPDTRIDGSWEGCSGYHYSDSIIYGFSHTHLSGTGVSDYGDILIMPTQHVTSLEQEKYASPFSHKNEKATAGYYQVLLDKYKIIAELTTSTRVGMHRYSYLNAGEGQLVIDLNHRDKLLHGSIEQINPTTFLVYRKSRAWAENQYCFAKIELSKPMQIAYFEADTIKEKMFSGKKVGIILSGNFAKNDTLLVKVSLSFTGFEGAIKNMQEVPNWDFNQVWANAQDYWNKVLQTIQPQNSNITTKTIFYTSMYHLRVHPNIATDVDGFYRGMDQKIHQANNYEHYTVFSLWDTFRAAHPLFALIDQKRTRDFLISFEHMAKQGGLLPVWELAANETNCMIGYHAVSVIADALVKGIEGPDYHYLFEASKKIANQNRLGLPSYINNGYISIDDEHESVSKTLEYAYNDWCIAQMAKALGHLSDYETYMQRAQNWKNLWNENNKFIQPKKNGAWLIPFNPKEVNNHYTEANGWQYTFFVPHDINGLISAMGGIDAFEQQLDELFNTKSDLSGRHQVDITGLIGQYAHGNEPSHHVAFLYHYIGKPEKGDQIISQILEQFYLNEPDGLIGNEDCGQMSAWYILSSMGIYNICPGQPYWTTCAPAFDYQLSFENGQKILITKQTSAAVRQTLGLNNVRLINNKWPLVVPVPYLNHAPTGFKSAIEVEIRHSMPKASIFYSLNNGKYKPYMKALTIQKTSKLSFYAQLPDGVKSYLQEAKFVKKPNNYSIALQSSYTSLYHAGGDDALLDGVEGTTNWRKGDWHGYYAQDFEAIIDLKKRKEIKTVGANFLQDTRAWILMPTEVTIWISQDGVQFEKVANFINQIDAKDEEAQIQRVVLPIKQKKARYVKLVAKHFGKLPEWHQGAPFGGAAYIFIDEIFIE